jgi:signal transduction histidine kinase
MGHRKNRRDFHQLLKSRAINSALMGGNHILAQAAIDSFADLSDLPLTLYRRADPEKLFRNLSRKSTFFSHKLGTIQQFLSFVRRANTNPIPLIEELDRNIQEWKPIFDYLSRNFLFTRPSRSEPVIRLLRSHWTWRWAEILSVLDSIFRGDDKSEFYDRFSENIWLKKLLFLDSQLILALGPIKNKDLPAQTSVNLASEFVRKYYAIIGMAKGPAHPIERYEQFYYDRPSIYSDDLEYRGKIISRAIQICSSIRWTKGHQMDNFDVTAATEFSYCIAGFEDQPWISGITAGFFDFSVSHYYPLYLRASRRNIRQLVFQSPKFGASVESKIDFGLVDLKSNLSSQPLLIKVNPIVGNKDVAWELSRYLNHDFEQAARRRRTTQSQRLLEELLMLRYQLADNFGVLTSDQSDLQENKKGDKETQLEIKLGRKIARSATEVCHCESAVIYRYDHLNNVLYSVGAFVDDQNQKALTRNDYGWMEDVGKDPERRKRSVAYAAASTDRCVAYDEVSDFQPLVENKYEMVKPPRESRVPAGKSLLALPIKVFGRLWGVFEIVSNHPNAFSYSQIEWLQKVADLIGPYYHEQLMINSLFHIASPINSARDPASQFDELAKEAAGIFLCNTACVWVRDVMNANQFNCVGFTGRDDLVERRRSRRLLPSFLISNVASIAGRAIQKKKIWVSGKIGDAPFSGSWLEKEHTRNLLNLEYNYIAIMPIYDLDQNAIAAVSIYSRHRPFASNWENWAKYVSSYMGVVISRVHNLKEIEHQHRRLIAHEISTAAQLAGESTKSLAGFINHLPAPLKPNNIANWISDIGTHVNDIKAVVQELAAEGDESRAQRPEAVMLARAQDRLKLMPPPDILFRTQFNACIGPLFKEMRKKGMRYRVQYPRGGIVLRIHPEDLRMILNNLLGNAIKYADRGSIIFCDFVEQPFGARFTVTNIGPAMETGESLRIFDFGFRGSNARGRSPGSGLGLYVVKRLSELYDVSVGYDWVHLRGGRGGNSVIHRVHLDFPAKMVVDISASAN